jgi:hypothetical protein
MAKKQLRLAKVAMNDERCKLQVDRAGFNELDALHALFVGYLTSTNAMLTPIWSGYFCRPNPAGSIEIFIATLTMHGCRLYPALSDLRQSVAETKLDPQRPYVVSPPVAVA